MLAFRSQQFTGLEDRAAEVAICKFADMLAEKYRGAPPENVPTRWNDLCRRGFEQAKVLNVTAELHVFALIYSMSLLGIDYFDRSEFAWAREILTSPHMPEEIRVGLLRLRILIDTSTDIFDHG